MSIQCDITQDNCYQVVIIGGGPAAVSAAIYCHRFDLKVIIIGEEYGGAISRTYLVENYPGYFDISGFDLMEKFQQHYEHFNIPYEYDTVLDLNSREDGGFDVKTAGDKHFIACSIIVATGGKYRKLNIPGEEEFHGRGVSYCATCDGPFFREKRIIVVGGSDSAAVEALFLSRFGKEVFIIYRREKIRAEPINEQRCNEDPKIKIINNTVLKRIIGEDRVHAVEFDDGTIFEADAVFIEIGQDPQSAIVKPLGVNLNEKGEIIVDKYAQTNIPGIFAAGDVTNIREKQVITAAGQAVTASYSVRDYLQQNYCVE